MCYTRAQRINQTAGLPDRRQNIGGGEMDVRVGDILEMKKPHPCGNRRFAVLRVGMDFRLKCEGCGHEILVPRLKIERHIRKIEHLQEEHG